MGYPKGKKLTHVFLWDFDVSNTGADSHTATGVIPILSLPANSIVHNVFANVITAVTGSTAEEVGDGTDVDGYLTDGFAANAGVYPVSIRPAASTFAGVFSLVQTAGATDAADVDTVPEQKIYASADTLDYKISGTATAGKIQFVVEWTRLNAS